MGEFDLLFKPLEIVVGDIVFVTQGQFNGHSGIVSQVLQPQRKYKVMMGSFTLTAGIDALKLAD
jgi:ribosomal protein L24